MKTLHSCCRQPDIPASLLVWSDWQQCRYSVPVAIKDHILAWPEAKKAHPWVTAWSVEAMQVEEVRTDPSLSDRQTAANICASLRLFLFRFLEILCTPSASIMLWIKTNTYVCMCVCVCVCVRKRS
jgi:hypothetical protein